MTLNSKFFAILFKLEHEGDIQNLIQRVPDLYLLIVIFYQKQQEYDDFSKYALNKLEEEINSDKSPKYVTFAAFDL